MSYVSDGLVLGNWQLLPRQPSSKIRPIELPGTMNQAGATKSSPFAYTHWVYDVASKNIINQTYMVFIYLAPALQGLVCALWYRLVSRGIEVHQQKLPRGNFSFSFLLVFFQAGRPCMLPIRLIHHKILGDCPWVIIEFDSVEIFSIYNAWHEAKLGRVH